MADEQTKVEETTTETTVATEEQTTSETAGAESGTEQTTASEEVTQESTADTTDEASTETKASEEQQETATDESTSESVERVVPAPDAYELPEGVPEQLAQFAHQNDMTQEQLNNTLGYFGQYLKATDDHTKQAMRQEGEKFVESWGKQKEQNLALVHRALQINDPEGELKGLLEDTGFGNHPAVLSFFQRLGTQLKEGGFIRGAVHVPQGQKSAAQTLFGNHPSSQN